MYVYIYIILTNVTSIFKNIMCILTHSIPACQDTILDLLCWQKLDGLVTLGI